MSSAHVAIVWNPSKSPRDVLERALASAFDAAEDAEFTAPAVSWHETAEDDPGVAATRDALAAGATLVIAAGGDGTVRAVAEHLADVESEADLGIVPMGTGNLLARNLGLPLTSRVGAFTRALAGDSRTIDVGWAMIHTGDGGSHGDAGGNSSAQPHRYAFTVMAGFGIDAHMITETNDELKDSAGWLAYVESLGRAVTASEIIDVTLTEDDGAREPTQLSAHTLIAGNCGMLQGGITLLPDADPADGALDLLVLSAEGVGGWLDTMRNMMWDNGLKRLITKHENAENSESTRHHRFTSLTIELSEPRVFEVDGDDLTETSRIEISVQPAAIRVRV